MDPKPPSLFRNLLTRLFLLSLLALFLRFAYVITLRGDSCDDVTAFCFFRPSLVTTSSSVPLLSSSVLSDYSASSPPRVTRKALKHYSAVFQDLIGEGHVAVTSRSLCLESPNDGEDVFALRRIGVKDSFGVAKKATKPLVVSYKGNGIVIPFGNNSFDFVFSGGARMDSYPRQGFLAAEVARVLKPGGVFIVHTAARDEYSFRSFIKLFDCCGFVSSREIDGFNQIVLRKHGSEKAKKEKSGGVGDNGKCLVPGYKRMLVSKAEKLIGEEPLKPWLTLKKNIENVKYLPTMADINFKNRYLYVDVGARSYGSSIGGWFKKQYPKQNKTFEVYAIEADKAFYEEYRSKKAVTLLPYAAWVKNETLFFEVNHDPSKEEEKAKGKGMGRIKTVRSDGVGTGVEIEGFDFADWLKNTVSEKDFVVMKMDVEGTEFELIPRLFESGAICLIDEVFLECHYNRWQRCCPGERSAKYEKTYDQCLDLFTSLRKSGVLVHQWW